MVAKRGLLFNNANSPNAKPAPRVVTHIKGIGPGLSSFLGGRI